MSLEDQNLNKALNYVDEALISLDRAINVLEKKGEFAKIKELEYVRMMLKTSRKVMLYGLFHN